MNFNVYRFLTLVGVFLSLSLVFTACSDDDDDTPTPPEEAQFKSEGFVLVGTTSSGSAQAKYFEEMPTGTVDLSTGQDFPRFFPNSVFKGSIFLPRPDEAPGFSKYGVDAEGMLVEQGVLPTVSGTSFVISVRDAETGLYQDRANGDLVTVFNPTTLQVTGTIDMSAGPVPNDIEQRYQRFIFRGDSFFSDVRGNANGEQFTQFVVHQGSLATNSYVGAAVREGNGVGTIQTYNNFGQNYTDVQGNLYINDAGNFEAQGIPARINKIPAGQGSFDADYNFFPSLVLNPQNVFLPTYNEFTVIPGTNKALARVNAFTPQEAIDIVLAAGGINNLTEAQIQQIFQILFTAESAQWCELDLEAQTVTPILGVPNVGVFSGNVTFFHNGELYFAVSTETQNAYYRYNPDTGQAAKAFDVTGADISGMYNIGRNN